MMSIKERIETFFRNVLDRDAKTAGKFRLIQIRFLRLFYVIARELSGEQLTLRAMGLVYTTLLSIVPLLAVSFSVLKAFGVHTRLEIFLYYFLEPLGPQGSDLAVNVIGFVEKVNVGVLGSIGLATLIYTVISQVQKIETALNYIWNVKAARSLAMRFSNYMSILLLGPVLIFSAAGFTASLMSTAFMHALLKIEPFGTVIYFAGKLLPFAMVCAAFTFLYYSLPNTKVRFSSAFAGGAFAGLSWTATGLIFTSFVVSSAQYSAIYSGFAVLILFLIWLYWSFLILLIGARVSFYHQNPQFITMGRETFSLSARLREKLALCVMYLIGTAFHENGRPWNLASLAERLRVSSLFVQDTLSVLEQKRLIISSGDDPHAYYPARDLEAISVKEVIDSVRSAGEDTHSTEGNLHAIPEIDKIMKRMDEIVADSLRNETMESLIALNKNAPGSPLCTK